MPGPENGLVKFRWRPASISRSRAIPAARSESSMNTIALTDETAPQRTQSNVRSVFSVSRPQSSAFTIRRPAYVDGADSFSGPLNSSDLAGFLLMLICFLAKDPSAPEQLPKPLHLL